MKPAAVLILPLLTACAATGDRMPAAPTHPVATARPVTTPIRIWTLDDLRIPDTPVGPVAPAERPVRPVTEPAARDAVAAANREGLDLPTPGCFTGKSCTYWYHPDKQFRVYMAQDNQTLVCLKPAERVLNVVAPGEQVWLPHAVYGYGPEGARTECVAFMPRRAGLKHQVSIFTDQRKYDLDVQTWTQTRHVEVRWRYPEDVLAALNSGADPAMVAHGPEPGATGSGGGSAHWTKSLPTEAGAAAPTRSTRSRLRYCAYALSGDAPAWHPVQTADGQPPVCDDGEVTVIHLPGAALGGQGMPAVWRLDGRGRRLPVQAQRIGSTLQVAGVHPILLLGLEGEEVLLARQAAP